MTGKRLLWVTEHYPPVKGGMATSCARQVRGLRKRGVVVDVLAMGRWPSALETRQADGGTDLYARREKALEVGANLAWSAVRDRHLRAPYDCAVGFGASWAGFLATSFAAWLGVPAVMLVRGNDMDRDWFLPRRGAWLREAFSRAAAIGAVSREKVERIRGMYPGRPVLWTPNGIDFSRWELLAADIRKRDEVRSILSGGERRIFGLFGELKYKKRIPFWLEAVRDRGLLRKMALLVVGSLDEETARILDDPAIAPISLRMPFCPPGELPGLYAACDFVAIPSAFEGMPNVLLEAMACGAAPLVSDAGAMGDIVQDGETGFVFHAEDREAAGKATQRAIDLPLQELLAMSERARQDVRRRFPPEQEIETLIELLRQAMP